MSEKEYLVEKEIDDEIIGLPEYFKKQRKLLQQINSELGYESCSIQKIAENLEISVDMFQKKLNGGKPLSREWLIAICAAFGFNSIRTNKVLNFAGYPKLDFEVPWENFITDFMNEKDNINRPHTLKEINDYLVENGCNEICLKFKRNKAVQSDSSGKKTEQYEIKKIVKIITDKDDIYNSIGLTYDFRSRVLVVAYLMKNGEIKYTLQVSSDGKYFSLEENGVTTTYKKISETGDFAQYFTELFVLAKNEQKKIDFQLFDTKRYYKYRLGANIINDSLHVFCEKFNYYTPEKNEYYLMEYIDGHLRLSVSEQSMFMKLYLSEDEYKKHYGYIPESKRIIYNSFDSVRFLDDQYNLLYNKSNAFRRLSEIIIDTIKGFKNGKLHIHTLEDIFENPLDIFEYYHLEKEADCTYDEEECKICPVNKKIKIPYGNDTVCISIDELQRAFELGFDDCGQICRVKKKYGSIKKMVSSINLEELKKEADLI